MKPPRSPSSKIRRRVASPPRRIETMADVTRGINVLRQQCNVIGRIHEAAGDPPLRRSPGGFPGLARIIVGQQVSVASAAAIWSRFVATVEPLTASCVAKLTDADLAAIGLSRPKIRTLRAVVDALADGLDLEALTTLEASVAHDALTAIKGIGPWTADVYLMFCIGHMDVFAPGDLALQVAAQLALELPERPDAGELATIAASRWSPYRGVAARLLWHYYAHVKAGGSRQPV